MNYYKHYEKLMKMKLEESIVKTSEYHSFSEIYPRITESIRLKREIERLTNKLKNEKARSTKFKIKREISITKTKLTKITSLNVYTERVSKKRFSREN